MVISKSRLVIIITYGIVFGNLLKIMTTINFETMKQALGEVLLGG